MEINLEDIHKLEEMVIYETKDSHDLLRTRIRGVFANFRLNKKLDAEEKEGEQWAYLNT